jgi:hypothetical protein
LDRSQSLFRSSFSLFSRENSLFGSAGNSSQNPSDSSDLPELDGGYASPKLEKFPVFSLIFRESAPEATETGSLMTAPTAKTPGRDILFQRVDRALKPAECGHSR